jgi:hypothetical protein
MRRNGDYRPDAMLKREMPDSIRGDGYRPVRAFEDQPRCVEMYEAAGIPVTIPGRTTAMPVAAGSLPASDDGSVKEAVVHSRRDALATYEATLAKA